MGFQKIIQSGGIVEYYSYSRDIFPRSLHRSKRIKYKSIIRRLDNQISVRNRFRRIFMSNLGSFSVFVTLTFALQIDIKQAYDEFRLFSQRMRNYYGNNFRYICVPEFGQKNTKRLHFHVVYWDLPLSVLDERSTRIMASIWGLGFVDLVKTDSSIKLAYYVSKYVLKALDSKQLLGQKAYTCSRNVLRPVIITSYDKYNNWGEFKKGWDIDYIKSLTGICSLDSLVLSREYDTLYLGRCNYKMFNNINNKNEYSNNKN